MGAKRPKQTGVCMGTWGGRGEVLVFRWMSVGPSPPLIQKKKELGHGGKRVSPKEKRIIKTILQIRWGTSLPKGGKIVKGFYLGIKGFGAFGLLWGIFLRQGGKGGEKKFQGVPPANHYGPNNTKNNKR